ESYEIISWTYGCLTAILLPIPLTIMPRNVSTEAHRRIVTKVLHVTCALLCGSVALANTDTFTATGPSSGGATQNASAIFVTGPGTLNITLNNLISNPKTIGQDISGIFFTLSSGATSGSL